MKKFVRFDPAEKTTIVSTAPLSAEEVAENATRQSAWEAKQSAKASVEENINNADRMIKAVALALGKQAGLTPTQIRDLVRAEYRALK